MLAAIKDMGTGPFGPATEEPGPRAPRYCSPRHGGLGESLHAPVQNETSSSLFKAGFFILLGDLPANRQVGYIAIGDARNRPISIGHCALAERYDRAGVAKELPAAGFSAGQGGGIAMLPDPDGIELQLFQPPLDW
jgi:hypothetical protein